MCEPKKVDVSAWAGGMPLPGPVPHHLEEARTCPLPGSLSLVGQASWNFSGGRAGSSIFVCSRVENFTHTSSVQNKK